MSARSAAKRSPAGSALSPASTPTVRRRLGVELRRLREAAGLTGEQVIARVGWASASKLSRLENGRSRPDLGDVLDLLDAYEVAGPLRDELVAVTREAGNARAWLRSYPVMTPRQHGYAELEASCAEIREYAPVLVPGLLQTPEYTRVRILSSQALTRPSAGTQENGWPDTEVAARLARQARLTQGVDPPRYEAVLDEAALGCRSGPAEVVQGQLVRLRDLAEQPNVTLRVLLREATIADWYLPHTAFSIYGFAHPQDPETVAIEGLSTHLVLTERSEIDRYTILFDWLRTAALSAEDSLAWLAEASAGKPTVARKSAGSRGSTGPAGAATPRTPPAQRTSAAPRTAAPRAPSAPKAKAGPGSPAAPPAQRTREIHRYPGR